MVGRNCLTPSDGIVLVICCTCVIISTKTVRLARIANAVSKSNEFGHSCRCLVTLIYNTKEGNRTTVVTVTVPTVMLVYEDSLLHNYCGFVDKRSPRSI